MQSTTSTGTLQQAPLLPLGVCPCEFRGPHPTHLVLDEDFSPLELLDLRASALRHWL